MNSFESEIQSRNCSCPGHQFVYKMPTSSGPTRTRSTVVTETPCDDWRVSWQMVVLLPPCNLIRLMAFGYEYGLRSDLRGQNFPGEVCPQTPLACACVCVLHHRCPPILKYLPLPLSGCIWYSVLTQIQIAKVKSCSCTLVWKRCRDGASCIYLPSFLYHAYLVCILFWHAIPTFIYISDFL